MKFCLLFAFQNEAPWLRLHLPIGLQAQSIDGVLALDGGSQDDSTAVVEKLGGIVIHRAFDYDWSSHFNFLLDRATGLGFDAFLRLDPDELMFPEHIDIVARLLREFNLVALARYNFERDRRHWRPQIFPDYQYRAWRLNHNIRYVGHVHEMPNVILAPYSFRRDLPIYHYEGIKPNRERQMKSINYDRVLHDLPPLSEPLADLSSWSGHPAEPFTQPQPLDPALCGLFAPLQEPAYAA